MPAASVLTEELRDLTRTRNALKAANAEIERLARLDSTRWEDLTAARGVRDAAHIALVALLQRLLGAQRQQAVTNAQLVIVVEPVAACGLLADAKRLEQAGM